MYATLASSAAAIESARRLASESQVLSKVSVSEQSPLVHQICAEAGIWAPDAARRALEQSGGEPSRAVALVRVWAATLPHMDAETTREDDIEITRRLSAAYAEIPGGQWLGPSDEQAPRLLTWNDPSESEPEFMDEVHPSHEPDATFTTRRSHVQRVRDLVVAASPGDSATREEGPDPTRAALSAPLSRLGRLSALARGETGALISFSSVAMESRREAILLELSSSLVHFKVAHPRTGNLCQVVEVPIVEAEAVADALIDGRAGLVVGYGVSLGSLERRAIAIAILDALLQDGPLTLTVDDGTVMSAMDGLSASGIVEHLRLPHYVSFGAYLDSIKNEEDSEE
jgi:alpha-D-ribose 1-methylphosphonate 5-triphosphate synthase subunit PhnI